MATWIMLFIYWLLASTTAAAAALPRNNEAYGPDLCVVNTPLVTRFFTAWTESRVSSRGCCSTWTKLATHEVHVIRVINAPNLNEVTLELVNGSQMARTGSRLVIVLDADVAVRWNIRAYGIDPQLQHTIVITGHSELDQSDIRISVTRRHRENWPSLVRYLERRFKSIHTFAEVENANRIRLTVGLATNSTATSCDYETTETSPVVEAWKNQKQVIEGCFHDEHAGLYPKDVHIIDIGGSSNKGAVNDVHLHLASNDVEVNDTREVALVLRSAHPVRWIVTSAPQLSGSLVILADHAVENAGISPLQNVEVRSQLMPDSFALLILKVTSDLGPPVSYVKTQMASKLELVVNKKRKQVPYAPDIKQESLSGAASHSPPFMEMGVRSLDRGHNHHTPTRGGSGRSVTWTVQQALRVQCASNHMTASLPRPMADALGVVGVTLSDRNCAGSRNATHWSIKTHVTSCSSTTRIDGKLTTYSNTVHVQLGVPQQSDDEDFEGSGFNSYPGSIDSSREVTIPIQCHYEPNFPIGGFHKVDDDNVMDTVEASKGQMELYHMEIHRNKEFTIPVTRDLSKGQSAAEVVFDETLHVRTWIDGVSYIQIVTEKCWVSNSSDSNRPPRLILIRNTCPADLSVQIRQSTDDSNGGFSFHVSKDYADMGQLYVHCKLGLCTNDPVRAQGNLKLCVEPSQYCTGRHVLKPFLDESVSTAQQILVRGPLRMVSKLSPGYQINVMGEVSSSTSSTTVAQNTGSAPSAQVIVVGVSTEVAVGIALASFVIGVGLTAILWCIHMRTDPYRRVSNGKARSNRNGRCPGIKCSSPMIRTCSLENVQSQQVSQQQQQQQQQQQEQQQQYQYSYDYDVSSQSNSSGSQCSREDSSPTPSSQTPMNATA